MAAAVDAGQVVYLTPDMPRKLERGTPVIFFGREVYLPAGAFVLAMRTGAPLFMSLARRRGRWLWLAIEGPWQAASAGRPRGWRAGAR